MRALPSTLLTPTAGGTATVREGVVYGSCNRPIDVGGLKIADPHAMETEVSHCPGSGSVGIFARDRASGCQLGTAQGGVGDADLARRFARGANPQPHPLPSPSTSPLCMRLRLARHALALRASACPGSSPSQGAGVEPCSAGDKPPGVDGVQQ